MTGLQCLHCKYAEVAIDDFSTRRGFFGTLANQNPMKNPPSQNRGKTVGGFTLIVTLSMMILLTVISVGLLSLSAISLRTSSQSDAQQAARANARLSLLMALGSLQREMGPDNRISAPADLKAGSDPTESSVPQGTRKWTAVYDAWGPPTNIGADDPRPDPTLRQWLVSGDPSQLADVNLPNQASGADTVDLVGENTVGPGGETVRVKIVTLPDGPATNQHAWWVGDLGTKALIAAAEPADNQMISLRARQQAMPGYHFPLAGGTGQSGPFSGVETTDPRISHLASWQTSALLAGNPTEIRGLYHDLTTFNRGLLTNVRQGGFRKDLSMYLEAREPALQLARVPLYSAGGEDGINFQELWAYYNSYNELYEPGATPGFTTGGQPAPNTPRLLMANNEAGSRIDDWFFIKQPVVISYQMIFSLSARSVTVSGQVRNRLHIVADPVITFWNPLDVPVVVPRSHFFSVKYFQIPYDLNISVNGGPIRRCHLRTTISGDANYLSLRAGELEQLVFKPGEVIKVSQTQDTTVGLSHNLQGRSGFNFGGGVAAPISDAGGQPIDLTGNATITYHLTPNHLTSGKRHGSGGSVSGGDEHTRHFSLTHNEYYVGADRGGNSLGIGGMYVDWDFGNKRLRPGETRDTNQVGSKVRSQRLYANNPSISHIFRPITGSETRPLPLSALNGRKEPIFIQSFNAKTEAGAELGTKSFSRFNPKVMHVDFYDLKDLERDLLPYEYTMEPLSSWKNRSIETSPNGNAYFGGGLDAGSGTSFVSTHSIPREPIVSLAALQHSFANGFYNQRPVYGYATLNAREPMLPQVSHAIGNSLAPAALASDQVRGQLPGPRPLADHSYLANAALWDDWFFSGIAPQMVRSFSTKRPQRNVAQDFFDPDVVEPLPVAAYKPVTGGMTSTEILSQLFAGPNPRPDSKDRVAQLLEVEGMFNVNSTSVEAWKTLLGALRGEPVAARNASGGEITSTTEENATPVASLIGPADEIVEGGAVVDIQDEAQWIGRRTLTDDEIDSLARAIVIEVRKRGPFISLADFINRRVGPDPELARAGAIQSAIDSLEAGINRQFEASDRIVRQEVLDRSPFPEAEQGPISFGIPGMVKQADILTPIASILSARSDSFVIRGYGAKTDANVNVLARAWCEAVVQRTAAYVDPADEPDTALASLNATNQRFGRRFNIVSFRWLNADEV